MRELLAAFWSPDRFYGLSNPLSADGGMPRGSSDPSHSGSWMAHLADLGIAWRDAPLTPLERDRAFLYYGARWEQEDIAWLAETSQQAVSKSIDSAVEKLADHMNGARQQ